MDSNPAAVVDSEPPRVQPDRALRYDRFGLYNLSRNEDVMTLSIAITEVYGVPPEHMLLALQQPTHRQFLAVLQTAGTISGLWVAPNRIRPPSARPP